MEILSHGGLPNGMTIEDFYEGISHPRNSTFMRVFLNMGLTEHTGHGVPTIIDKYGKEVFEITDNYIKCKIPFDRKVLELSNKNVGLNVGLNDGLNKTGKADADKIDLLREMPPALLVTVTRGAGGIMSVISFFNLIVC